MPKFTTGNPIPAEALGGTVGRCQDDDAADRCRDQAHSSTPGIRDCFVPEAQRTVLVTPRDDFSQSQESPRPKGALIIEDDLLLRKSLGQGFRNGGFDLWSAANGAEGVELYRQFWPLIDVVLSDVQMPVLDGPGTLGALREINPSVRFCFMTGDTRAATRARLLKHGALQVFDKPLPSVGSVVRELWDLAACPNQVSLYSEDTDTESPHPDPSTGETCLLDRPDEYRVFARIYASLLTSISRIGSMLRHRDF